MDETHSCARREVGWTSRLYEAGVYEAGVYEAGVYEAGDEASAWWSQHSTEYPAMGSSPSFLCGGAGQPRFEGYESAALQVVRSVCCLGWRPCESRAEHAIGDDRARLLGHLGPSCYAHSND